MLPGYTSNILELSFGELGRLDFTEFQECDVANMLQTQNFSLLLTAP